MAELPPKGEPESSGSPEAQAVQQRPVLLQKAEGMQAMTVEAPEGAESVVIDLPDDVSCVLIKTANGDWSAVVRGKSNDTAREE